MLSEIIIKLGAPSQNASLRWLSDWLPDANRVTLTRDALTRINAYRGDAQTLHELLATVVPLDRPIWYETTVSAQGGAEMVLGYGAVPAPDGIDIAWACYAPAHGCVFGPLGPAHVTTRGMNRPPDISDESWSKLRSAAGIAIRALLLA
jgi:hypothetical protein